MMTQQARMTRWIACFSSLLMAGSGMTFAPDRAIASPPLPGDMPQLKLFGFGQSSQPGLGNTGGRSRSGSHRGSCGAAVPPVGMAALVPPTSSGLTTDASPTFWFFMPYAADSGVEGAKFMLLDQTLHPLLEDPIAIALPSAPGIISFQLPDSVAPLEVGERYNWYFSVVCDAQKPSRNPVVSGWIERVAPDATLTSQLSTTPAEQNYRAYADNGIWFDTVTRLAQQRCRNPQNSTLNADWNSLLQDINMADLANQPLVCHTNADQLGS